MSDAARRWGWLALVPVVVSLLLVAITDEGAPRTNADRVRALTASLACPVCEGQSVAESEHPTARNIENTVRIMVDDGRTDGEIRAEIARDYGDFVDLRPPRSGVAGLVWVLPVAFGVAAVAGLAAAFRRWRRPDERVGVSDADRALVDRYRGADG